MTDKDKLYPDCIIDAEKISLSTALHYRRITSLCCERINDLIDENNVLGNGLVRADKAMLDVVKHYDKIINVLNERLKKLEGKDEK